MSRHKSSLPSLNKTFSLTGDLSSDDFSCSQPVVGRSFGGLFGQEDFTFSRADLRTPPDMRVHLELLNKTHKISKNRRAGKTPAPKPKLIKRSSRSKEKEAMLELESQLEDRNTPSKLDIKEVPTALQEAISFDRAKYCGVQAKLDFYDRYRQANRDFYVYMKDDDVPDECKTPRSTYLRELEKRSLPPLSLVMRHKDKPNGVFLANRGLGDLHMAPLVETIDMLPNVNTIDLNDNRLTDVTLMPLMLKLISMKTLTHLDLSFNKIDDSSEVIMDYIKSPECCLTTLMLNGADVDDTEAGNLSEALSMNSSLLTLSLAHNLLGRDEPKAAFNKELVTGGVAIGKMLEVNSTITKLDLSWNAIRLDSAEKLAASIRKNSTLVELHLGHNGFGDNATQIIGRALKTNDTLTALDISYNSLNPKSVAVLANSLVFNDKVSYVNLDGNILGKVGTQAMVAAIQRAASSVRSLHISFNDCDCRKIEQGLFDPANPSGTHVVDLSTPYGVMVVDECMYLANYRAGVTLVKLEYSSGGAYYRVPLNVVSTSVGNFSIDAFRKLCKSTASLILEGKSKNRPAADSLAKLMAMFQFKMKLELAIQCVNHIRKQWEEKVKKRKILDTSEELFEVLLFEVFFALFVINDDDYSGTVDVDEFTNTIDSLGLSISVEEATRLMTEFDKDNSGTIDANEFSTLMVNEYCRTEAPRGRIVDSTTNQPWVVPTFGRARIEIECVCDAPSVFDVGEDSGTASVIKAMRDAKTEEQRMLIFEQAVQSPYHFMTESQGQLLLEEICGPPSNRITKGSKLLQIVAAILPQLVSAEHCVKFIHYNLNDAMTIELRLLLGGMFNALTGAATGHYLFDLKNDREVMLCRKLASIATTETKYCRGMNCNTSQHGDFSHFRNEQLNDQHMRVTPQWIASTTSTNKLRLDFISTARPKQSIKAMNAPRFERLIKKMNLVSVKNRMVEIEMQIQLEKEKQLAEAYRATQEPPKASRQSSVRGARNRNSVLNRSKSKKDVTQSSTVDKSEPLSPSASALCLSLTPSACVSEVPSGGTTPLQSQFPTPRPDSPKEEEALAEELVNKYSVDLKAPFTVSRLVVAHISYISESVIGVLTLYISCVVYAREGILH